MAVRRRKVAGVTLERDFVLLLGAQFGAQAADGVAQAAFADALILEPLGRAPIRVLGIFALTLLPYSLIAPFMGVVADRWPRRGLMEAANGARAVITLSLALWATTLPGELALYAAALVLLGIGRLFLTVKGASLPFILHERHLLHGNALSGGGGMIAALVGGIVGLGVIGAANMNAALVAAGVLYAGSSLATRGLSDPMAHRHPRTDFRAAIARIARELVDGLRAVWVRERVRISLGAIFILRTLGIFVAIAAILIIKNEFPAVADRGGRLGASALALGAAGVGAFVGAATAPAVGRRVSKPGLILLGFAVPAATLLALGRVGGIATMLVMMFGGGYGAFVAKVAVDATVQESLPDGVRGRAFSLYDILYNAASVVAAAVMVGLSGTSTRALLVGTGVALLALGGAVAIAMRAAGMFSDARAREASSP